MASTINKRPLVAAAITLAVAAGLMSVERMSQRSTSDQVDSSAPSTGGGQLAPVISPIDSQDDDQESQDAANREAASEEKTSMPNHPDLPRVKAIQLAIEDYATLIGAEPSAIQVDTVESVTWNDGSLGCPQPDMMYAQVLTPGYRISFSAPGEEAVYHTDQSRQFVRCVNPKGAGGAVISPFADH